MMKLLRFVSLFCAILLLAVGCTTPNPNEIVVEGPANSPQEAFKGLIDAFKVCDGEKLALYCIDQGGEESIFGTIPEEEMYRRIIRAQLAAFQFEMDDVNISGDSATAVVTITTWSVKDAVLEYMDRVYSMFGGVQPTGEEYVKLWEGIYSDGTLITVTASENVEFEKVDGYWKVVADEDVSLLLAGGVENTSASE